MAAVSASTGSFEARPLGALATEIPGATAVFRKYKLDFCCGGAATLADAAAAKGLSAETIAAELAALKPANSEVPEDPRALVGHILTRYHEVHRRELPELVRLAKRVEAVHGERPECPKGVASLLHALALELTSHMQKEEMILFPMMEEGSPAVVHPIAVMRAEHDDAGVQIKKIEALMAGTPVDACNTWRALDAGVAKFVDDLMNHIHLENNVLFPAFENGAVSEGCGCGHNH